MRRANKVDLVIFLFFCAFIGALVFILNSRVYIFDGIVGPVGASIIPKAEKVKFNRYAKGSASRLAILLTDEDSGWLGLAHGLMSIGVPFLVTEDYKSALEHEVVMVYPMISGRVLSPDALKAIAAFPRKGGTLIGVNVLGGGVNDVFGFKEAIPSKDRVSITYDNNLSLLSPFDSDHDIIHVLQKNYRENRNRNKHAPVRIGTYGYSSPSNNPIAVFNDGTAAITQKPYATGGTYGFGIDIGTLLLKGYNLKDHDMSLQYVNGFDPKIDIILMLIRNIYLRAVPNAVTIRTVPFNKDLSVMITHDVDYSESIGNSLKYADYEKSQGIKATFFIQTKYIRDWNDEIFFDEEKVNIITQLEALGMEVGSHSVSHSTEFNEFPLGSGEEQYPDYRPFVKKQLKTTNGTILGELRVSKFLLENFMKRDRVLSFRPGYLSNPHSLSQALMATGYLYSSSVTANKSLTHLPFQLNINRGFDSESTIYEFPVTVEDEHLPLMGERLSQAIDLAKKISAFGGTYVVMIHPDIFGHKFEFIKGFIPAVRDFAIFATVSEFGSWWSARDNIELDIFPEDQKTRVRLNAPKGIRGLTLDIPDGSKLLFTQPKEIHVTQYGNRLVIEEAAGLIMLYLDMPKVNSNDSPRT